MANPNIYLHGWKKGQSGNPSGKCKIPPHLRIIKQFTADEIQRIIAKYGRSTIDDIVKVIDDKSAQMIDRVFAQLFSDCFNGKPEYRLSTIKFLLDRSIGKIPDVVMPDLDNDEEREKLKNLTIEELLQLVRKIIPDSPEPLALDTSA